MRKGDKKYVVNIYAIYDRDDEIVFIGSAKQCSEYIGCNVNKIWISLSTGSKIKWKYTICKLEDKEYIIGNTKVCSRCGKEKSLKEFPKKRNVHINMCRNCYNEYSREKRLTNERRKKNENY